MKKTAILTCVLCLSAIVSGQEDTKSETTRKVITFEYDEAGNRINRKVVEKQESNSENVEKVQTDKSTVK